MNNLSVSCSRLNQDLFLGILTIVMQALLYVSYVSAVSGSVLAKTS